MGIIMHKLVEVGEYCDCLQDWKKYEIPNESQSQSNLFMSQNDSNLDDPIDKVFNHQKIYSGLDKELEAMHQRLKKRKKLKAEYLKQKEKESKAKQKQEERIAREKMEKIEREREIWLRQLELKKQKEIQVEKLRKQKKEKQIKANKKNKRIRERNLDKHDFLQVQAQNNTFLATDEKFQQKIKRQNEAFPEQINQQQIDEVKKQPQIVQSGRQREQNSKEQSDKKLKEKEKKDKKSKKAKKQKKRKQSSSSQQSGPSSRQEQYQNVFQQPQYYNEQNPQVRQEQVVSDLDSALFQKAQQQSTQIEIIDLEKLNPYQLKQQISHLAIKKIRDMNDNRMASQTMPLHPAIHSHRVSNIRNHDMRKNQLRLKGNEHDEQEDNVEFGDGVLQSTIIEKESNDYFLDENDKEEYLKDMFH